MAGNVKSYNEFVLKRFYNIRSDVLIKSIPQFKIDLFEVFHFVDT